MRQLIAFFYTYRVTFLFLLLQGVSFLLVYQNNRYQRLVWLSSASQVVGNLMEFRDEVMSYATLDEANRSLATENALLRLQLEQLQKQQPIAPLDTSRVPPYDFVPARVIRHSTRLRQNYLTLDKGSTGGLKPGMALITGAGVVGRIKGVSENFATAYPVVNPRFSVSVRLADDQQLFSVNWQGGDPRYASLLQVSRGARVEVGDTVVTSGADAIFPDGLPVGVIRETDTRQTAGFLDVSVELFVDFTRLHHVYAIRNNNQEERDSLEQAGFPGND